MKFVDEMAPTRRYSTSFIIFFLHTSISNSLIEYEILALYNILVIENSVKTLKITFLQYECMKNMTNTSEYQCREFDRRFTVVSYLLGL